MVFELVLELVFEACIGVEIRVGIGIVIGVDTGVGIGVRLEVEVEVDFGIWDFDLVWVRFIVLINILVRDRVWIESEGEIKKVVKWAAKK